MDSAIKYGLLAVGGYLLYEWLFATPATAATAAPASTAPASPAPAQSAFNKLDAIYSRLKTAAAADPNFTGSGDSLSGIPNRFNVYLARVWDGTATGTAAPANPITVPDPGAVFPGVDLNQPMTAATYWAGMSKALSSQYGLSGLGFYGGLGALIMQRQAN
jgi:hypothetical protein